MDIINLPVECDEKTMDSRYRLVIVVSQRAKQLMEGAPPASAVTAKYSKPTTIALREVIQGQVEFLTGKEALAAAKEAKKVREGEASRRPFHEEDIAEIKKDLSHHIGTFPEKRGDA